MSASELPLVHIVRQPRITGAAPPALILFHGYGSNEHDLFSLAPYLDERLLVVSVRAPLMLMPGSYAWFEIAFYQDDDGQTQIAIEPRQAALSGQTVTAFVRAAVEQYGIDPAQLYVGGFSQGASMAAIIALTSPDLVAGTIILSGLVPAELIESIPEPEALHGKPFFVGHGTTDAVVQIAHGRASRDLLTELATDLTYREYRGMAHEINAACLGDVRAWLQARIG